MLTVGLCRFVESPFCVILDLRFRADGLKREPDPFIGLLEYSIGGTRRLGQ